MLGDVALGEVRRWANTCDDDGGRLYALPLVDAYEGLRAENELLTRNRDAARMMIGPLSERPDLVDACEDVVREVAHLKRVIDSKNELIDRLVTEVGKTRL